MEELSLDFPFLVGLGLEQTCIRYANFLLLRWFRVLLGALEGRKHLDGDIGGTTKQPLFGVLLKARFIGVSADPMLSVPSKTNGSLWRWQLLRSSKLSGLC